MASGEILSRSDCNATSFERVKARPPEDSSAEESFASATEPADKDKNSAIVAVNNCLIPVPWCRPAALAPAVIVIRISAMLET